MSLASQAPLTVVAAAAHGDSVGRPVGTGGTVGGREIQFIALPENRRDGWRPMDKGNRGLERGRREWTQWTGVLCRPGRPVSAREHGRGREERARAMECSLALSLLDPPRGSPANLQKPYMLFP